MIKYVASLFLITLLLIGCGSAGKAISYGAEINTTFKPATLLKLTTEILADKELTDKDRIDLLKSMAERSLTVMRMYIMSVEQGDITAKSSELIDLVDFLQYLVKNYKNIDPELANKIKALAVKIVAIMMKGTE